MKWQEGGLIITEWENQKKTSMIQTPKNFKTREMTPDQLSFHLTIVFGNAYILGLKTVKLQVSKTSGNHIIKNEVKTY